MDRVRARTTPYWRLPSFTPGVEESPFITWGDLQGTPLRLDPEDDIEVDPAGASGPQFTIREVCLPVHARERLTVFNYIGGSCQLGGCITKV